jgi:pSer/pThr/pTyr-binding forkhead associated (FHA) protein
MPLRFRILPAADDAARGAPGVAGPLVEREVEVANGVDEIRVGRRADVELPLPFAALSAVHARLRRGPDGWTVEDAGSTNGTWLDDERLAPGARRAFEWGAELRLASVRLRFEGEGPPAPAAEGTATVARRLVSDLFAGADAGAPTLSVARGAAPRTLALVALDHPYVVGRGETCALPLDVEEVSREHAAFVRGAAAVVVRDLGSKNGVLVAGTRVAGERALVDGDVVEVGPVALRLDDPVGRYLRALEALAVEELEVAARPAPSPVVEHSVEHSVAPPAAPRKRRSTQLAVVVAATVLVLLALAAAALVFGRASLVSAAGGPSCGPSSRPCACASLWSGRCSASAPGSRRAPGTACSSCSRAG